MFKGTGRLAAAAAMTLGQIAFAQVNGSLDAGEYGAALAVQTTPTGFGNNLSELNAAYGLLRPDGSFRLLITGNLENGGNGLVIFLDARFGGGVDSLLPDGRGVLGNIGGQRADDWGTDTDGGPGVTPTPGGGSVLDPGFNPEVSFETNLFNQGIPQTNYYINIADLNLPNEPDPEGNSNIFLGTNFTDSPAATQTYIRNPLTTPTPSGDITHAFNNTNTAGGNGFDFGNPPGPLGDPLTATTGYELEYSALFLRADPLQPLRLLPFITNGGGDFLANQFLPGLNPGSFSNLGGAGGDGGTPLFDSSQFAGNQYIEVPLPTYTGGATAYSAAVFNWPTPNGVNTSAVFGDGTGGTVTLDVPVTLGGVLFSGANSYTLAGPSTLTLDAFGVRARVDVVSGSHTVTAPVLVNRFVEFSAAAGASLTLTNVSYAADVGVFKTGDGLVAVNNVRGGLLMDRGTLRLDSGTSVVREIYIGDLSTPDATLDLRSSPLIVDYTVGSSPEGDITPQQRVRAYITSGRAGGTWTGTGISSSLAAANSATHAVGYGESAEVLGAGGGTFGGVAVDGSALLIRYTRLGDANLSGTTDIGDFAVVAANFNAQTAKWTKGDFNYDGITNIGDFSLLASQFNQSAGDLPRAAVPEPASLGVIVLAAGMLRRRRLP